MKKLGIMKLLLLFILVFFVINIIPVEASTLGLWLFDEPSGNIAYDASGQGNDGIIYGATRTTDAPFSYTGNGAMSFDGVSNYINAGSDSSLYLTDSFTLEAWVKPKTVGLRYIADKSHIYCLKLVDGTQYPLAGIKKYEQYFDLISDTSISLNSWAHIASTYDGGILRLYVNGELVGENSLTSGTTDSSIHPSSDFIIGNHALLGYYSNYFFDGLIDEVRISDVALAPGQLGYHRSLGTPVPEPATISLLGLGLLGLVFRRKRGQVA